MLVWDSADDRLFQHGIDRGVLYPIGTPLSDRLITEPLIDDAFGVYLGTEAVAWNGITGVDEGGNGSSSINYLDGKIFLADSDATDYSAKLSAFFFPDAFGDCIGMPTAVNGLIVDNQKPKRFCLSYRSLIGSGSAGDMFGHQIHLVYNAMASVGGASRKTLNNSPAPIEFNFDLVATPVRLPGFRPTAHYIIDTRGLDAPTVAEMESILYGSPDGTIPARIPMPSELFSLLS